MDPQLVFGPLLRVQQQQFDHQALFVDHLIPYVILIINYVAFQVARSLIDRLLGSADQHQPQQQSADNQMRGGGRLTRLLRLFAHELVSTCELCADCAELNVVYEKHGSYAYGISLTLLTYLWMDSFGEAHTSPGYLMEEFCLGSGPPHDATNGPFKDEQRQRVGVLKSGDTYARFIGQSMAMPLAWRLASLYWRYELIGEHKTIADAASCKSSLSTSTLNGFAIELVCCLMCRLAELVANQLLERRAWGRRLVSLSCAFFCSLLVVLALELSGGYFNPLIAGALEFGCQGIEAHQHALVFWLGPLIGHVLARLLFRRYVEQQSISGGGGEPQSSQRRQEIDRCKQSIVARREQRTAAAASEQATAATTRRSTRASASQRRRKSDKLD